MGQYVQLLFAGVLEYVIFGTVPSALSLIGAAIIMASAIYVIVRSHFLRSLFCGFQILLLDFKEGLTEGA